MIIGCDYMEMKTITIEQIKANPNLDLSERIRKFDQDKNLSSDDLNDMAIASIKQEYEFWANQRENISPRTDAMLEQILNGHVLSKSEAFEMVCDDPKKVESYARCDYLNQRIKDNNGITLDDFNELCSTIGFDSNTIALMRAEFESKGLILDSYKDEKPRHR